MAAKKNNNANKGFIKEIERVSSTGPSVSGVSKVFDYSKPVSVVSKPDDLGTVRRLQHKSAVKPDSSTSFVKETFTHIKNRRDK